MVNSVKVRWPSSSWSDRALCGERRMFRGRGGEGSGGEGRGGEGRGGEGHTLTYMCNCCSQLRHVW